MIKKVIFSWINGFYGFSLFSDMKETNVEKDAILTQEDATAFGYENVEQLARAIVGVTLETFGEKETKLIRALN